MENINYKELIIGLNAIGKALFDWNEKETSQEIGDLISLIYKYAILNKANFGEINASHIIRDLKIIEHEVEGTSNKTLIHDFKNLRDLEDDIYSFAVNHSDYISKG